MTMLAHKYIYFFVGCEKNFALERPNFIRKCVPLYRPPSYDSLTDTVVAKTKLWSSLRYKLVKLPIKGAL
jgi:hypothetical protein